MKRTVKFLLVVLSIVMISSGFVACSNKDVPDGYQLIAKDGDTFRLYVPTQGWMPNTSSGVTSAYYSISNKQTGMPAASVSVYKTDDADGCENVEQYWEVCSAKLSAEFADYTYLSDESGTTVLGGEAAGRYVYTAKKSTGVGDSEQVTYKFMQIMAIHDGQMYVLIFSAPQDEYEARVADMNGNTDEDDLGIIGYFKFAEAYDDGEDRKYGKEEAPDGMKLASSKGRPYTMFAPESWNVDESGQITNVYTEDKSNLTVQYSIGDETSQSVETYWKGCMLKYQNILTDISEGECSTQTVGGVEGGIVGTFSGKSGGVEYKFKQAIVLKGEVYYVITYTAKVENYDAHIADVNKMIEHFKIK